MELCILIVEDGETVIEDFYELVFKEYTPFLKFLEETKLKITTVYAKTFVDAERLSSQKFDAVFLDNRLPINSGETPVECGYKLITNFKKNHVLVIGTSSESGIKADYDLYLHKSGLNTYEELFKIIKIILKNST